jgi:hypothetical protein
MANGVRIRWINGAVQLEFDFAEQPPQAEIAGAEDDEPDGAERLEDGECPPR